MPIMGKRKRWFYPETSIYLYHRNEKRRRDRFSRMPKVVGPDPVWTAVSDRRMNDFMIDNALPSAHYLPVNNCRHHDRVMWFAGGDAWAWSRRLKQFAREARKAFE